jgi:hypothetical protein
MPLPTYDHVVGHQFPGGTTTVPAWMNTLWGDAVLAPEDPSPNVHPVLVYYAAVQGSGIEFQDIFDLMGLADGAAVMLGEQTFTFNEPLQVGREYNVEGGMTSVVRKTGRRAGTFDIATFELRVLEPGADEPAAISTTSFVFQRKETEE